MITYYYLTKSRCSYSIIAKHHIQVLKNYTKVEEADVQYDIKPNLYALVHPLFFLRDKEGVNRLAKNHKYIIGFEVSDTDRPSDEWVEFLNNPKIDLIITASNFSYYAFKNAGVTNRIEVVPHGVSRKFRPYPKRPKTENIRVLTFIQHTPFRKGADILIEIAKRFPKVHFTSKGEGMKIWNQELIPPNISVIDRWMEEEDLVNFYNQHDIYLATQRGGGFEICPLEALACGLPVISSAYGSVLDYLNSHNSILVSPVGKTKLFDKNPYHHGNVCQPDTQHLADALGRCIENLDEEKEKALKASIRIRAKFNWYSIGKRIFNLIREIAEW